MKSIILLLAGTISASVMANGQKIDTSLIKSQKLIYERAIQYNDFGTAANALTIMLVNGADDNFNDSLSVVYYRSGNMAGAYKLANQQYAKNDKNLTALALLADISGRTSEVKTSLDWYEKLCALDGSPYNNYQLATKQFLLDRRQECVQSLQKVITDSAEAMQQLVTMDIGNGLSENVPVYAAACNMMGALAYKEKELAVAKTWYEKATKSFPEFVIAGENLKALDKEMNPPPASPKPGAAKPKQ